MSPQRWRRCLLRSWTIILLWLWEDCKIWKDSSGDWIHFIKPTPTWKAMPALDVGSRSLAVPTRTWLSVKWIRIWTVAKPYWIGFHARVAQQMCPLSWISLVGSSCQSGKGRERYKLKVNEKTGPVNYDNNNNKCREHASSASLHSQN